MDNFIAKNYQRDIQAFLAMKSGLENALDSTRTGLFVGRNNTCQEIRLPHQSGVVFSMNFQFIRPGEQPIFVNNNRSDRKKIMIQIDQGY
ncbi:hypothetical protein ACFL35_11100 [Candidatus Riflebacteria bacterium]